MKPPSYRHGAYEVRYSVAEAGTGRKRWKTERLRGAESPTLLARATARQAQLRARAPESATMRVAFEGWKSTRGDRDVRGAMEGTFRRHVEPVFGDRPIDSVSLSEWDRFADGMRSKLKPDGQPYSANTVFDVLNCARTIVNFAHKREWSARPWPSGVTVGEPQPAHVVVPTKEALLGLLDSIESGVDNTDSSRWSTTPEEFSLIVRCAISFGTRRQSILGLHVSDYRDGYVTFETSMNEARGKGLYERTMMKRTTPYTATVSAKMRPLIEQQIARRRSMVGRADHAGCACLHPTGGPILFSSDGYRPWTPNAVTARFRREADKAGLPKMTFHHLKHYAVTNMLDAGLTLEQVSHRTQTRVDTLETTYRKFVKGRDRAAADLLDDAIF